MSESLPAPQVRRILIVEDDHDLADSLVDLLEPLGFVTSTALDAREALKRLGEFDADLALIDVKLGMDSGIELVSTLRAKVPNLVCVLMTAYADLHAAVSALRSGAQDFLLKPLAPESLPAQLADAIDFNMRKVRMEREQRLTTIGGVCANVAHDVRNCLQGIFGELDFVKGALQVSPPNLADVMDGVNALSAVAQRATDICSRILDFAKGSGGEYADAAQVLRDCRPLISQLNRSQAQVEVKAPENAVWVSLGTTQLEQVVMNLVINACQAVAADGQVLVELITRVEAGLTLAYLRVKDNGCGIASDVLPRVFEPYFSTKAAKDGTGLGLSIVYGIVKAIQGADIWVESEVGVGSCFTIQLPTVRFDV